MTSCHGILPLGRVYWTLFASILRGAHVEDDATVLEKVRFMDAGSLTWVGKQILAYR